MGRKKRNLPLPKYSAALASKKLPSGLLVRRDVINAACDAHLAPPSARPLGVWSWRRCRSDRPRISRMRAVLLPSLSERRNNDAANRETDRLTDCEMAVSASRERMAAIRPPCAACLPAIKMPHTSVAGILSENQPFSQRRKAGASGVWVIDEKSKANAGRAGARASAAPEPREWHCCEWTPLQFCSEPKSREGSKRYLRFGDLKAFEMLNDLLMLTKFNRNAESVASCLHA